jgi:hypothetical protein
MRKSIKKTARMGLLINTGGHSTRNLHLRRMKMKKRVYYSCVVLSIFLLANCASVGVGGVYDTPSVFGGYAFYDYNVGQTNVGYITGNAESGNNDTKISGLNITQMGKILFKIINEKLYIFPELGVELNFAKTDTFLSKLLVRAGVGVDVALNEKFFIRGEGLYGLNIGRLTGHNEGLPSGFSARLAIGYQIKPRKTFFDAVEEKEAEIRKKREAEYAELLEEAYFFMPPFNQEYFDQNAFIYVKWLEPYGQITKNAKIILIDGKQASDYFYSRTTEADEYAVGMRAIWYCLSPGTHTFYISYRDQDYDKKITSTASGTITLTVEAGKAYELVSIDHGSDNLLFKLEETTDLVGIRYRR